MVLLLGTGRLGGPVALTAWEQHVPRKNGSGGPVNTGRDYGSVGGEVRGGSVSYLDADSEGLQLCIESLTLAGDAILFARTSDGGALSVRILSAGRTFMHYPTDSVALNELLTGLTEVSKG